MPQEEIGLLQSQAYGFMGQINYDTYGASKQAALPLVANLYAPELGSFVMNKEIDRVNINTLPGVSIQREEGGYFVPYDENENAITGPNGAQYRFKGPEEVRAFVGRTILQQLFSN